MEPARVRERHALRRHTKLPGQAKARLALPNDADLVLAVRHREEVFQHPAAEGGVCEGGSPRLSKPVPTAARGPEARKLGGLAGKKEAGVLYILFYNTQNKLLLNHII